MNAEVKLQHAFRAVREQLGMTQKQLAERLEVSPVYISYLENGTRTPSRKLLRKAYQLAGQELPGEVATLLRQLKEPEQSEPERTNTVYQLQSKGLYSLARLQRLVKAHPERLLYVLGLYQLYREQGRVQDAEQVLLNAIPQMQAPEDRKWLEAYHFQLEGSGSGYRRALAIMTEALELFEARHPQPQADAREKKAEMLFRMALIHYDFGVWFFNQPPLLAPAQLEAARGQFEAALARHRQLRACTAYPYAQLDYANLWLWLALISRYQGLDDSDSSRCEERNALEQFIKAAEEAQILHHRLNWGDDQGGLYTREYLLLNQSYLALACGRLAALSDAGQADLLRRGESLLAQLMPLQTQDASTLYRCSYNLAHYYSIAAEVRAGLGQADEAEAALDLCLRGLRAAYAIDPDSLNEDLALPLELSFLRAQRQQAVQAMLAPPTKPRTRKKSQPPEAQSLESQTLESQTLEARHRVQKNVGGKDHAS